MNSTFLKTAQAYQIAGIWKAAAAAESGAARNATFWACVKSLEARGFAGDARRFLEGAARWAR